MKGSRLRDLMMAVAVAAGVIAGPAYSQTAEPPGAEDALPIEIDADQALEWHQDEKAYVARGNAQARRGDLEVRADVLTAYYRELPGGGTEIWRFTADGNVRIASPTQEAYGDRAIYDIDRQVAVLTGEDLRLVTETDVVTARDSLEYWTEQRLAVARGDAVATRDRNKVRADMLIALFEEGDGGDLEIDRIDADGNVVVTTPTDVARGSKGVYDLDSNIATLTGDVRITRGQNQLNGQVAEVNLNTGISRVLSGGPQGGAEGRVRGLFVPGQDAGGGIPGAPQ